MIGGLSMTEVLVLVVIVLLLFGAKRIPDVFRGLGQGVHEFKKGIKGEGLDEGKKPPSEGDKKGE